jgi:hypothetical protein
MSPSGIVVMNGSNSKRISRGGNPGEVGGEEAVTLKLNLSGGVTKVSSEEVIMPIHSKNELIEAVEANIIEPIATPQNNIPPHMLPGAQ